MTIRNFFMITSFLLAAFAASACGGDVVPADGNDVRAWRPDAALAPDAGGSVADAGETAADASIAPTPDAGETPDPCAFVAQATLAITWIGADGKPYPLTAQPDGVNCRVQFHGGIFRGTSLPLVDEGGIGRLDLLKDGPPIRDRLHLVVQNSGESLYYRE